jgi:hypothetical protein
MVGFTRVIMEGVRTRKRNGRGKQSIETWVGEKLAVMGDQSDGDVGLTSGNIGKVGCWGKSTPDYNAVPCSNQP